MQHRTAVILCLLKALAGPLCGQQVVESAQQALSGDRGVAGGDAQGLASGVDAAVGASGRVAAAEFAEQALRYFTAAGLMLADGPPEALDKGQFAIGFDAANIPRLSRSERTVGFDGTKEENLNKTPVIGRPLVHFGITDRLSVTAAYVPPVEIFDRLETHLAGLYLNYELFRNARFGIGLRAGGQWSEATGDFTCAEDIAGCIEPSNDTFTSLTATAELSVDYRLRMRHPLDVFIGVAYTYADLEFEVDALWAGGFNDNRRLLAHGVIWSFSGGLKWALSEKIHATFAIIHTPLDVRRPPDFNSKSSSLTHFRLSVHLLL